MKKQQLLFVLAAALVVIVAAIFLLRRPPAPPVVPPPSAPESLPVAGGPTPAPAPEPTPAPAPEPETVVVTPTPPAPTPTEPGPPHTHTPPAPASAAIKVRASQILATVNNIPITLKDLVPLTPGDTTSEKEMEPEFYQSRLNRAIEAELTFQAARSQSVNLTDEQQQRLQQMRDRTAADIAEYKSQGLQWTSVTPQQIEFEQRLTSALLLQQNLVANSAGVSPQQPEYADALRQVLNQLRSNANIVINQPGSS